VGLSYGGGSVKNCVGLNGQIITTEISIKYGRVVGDINDSSLMNNYGRSDMTKPGGDAWQNIGPTWKDGQSVNANETAATTPNWWTAADRWSTANGASAWDFTNTWNPPNGTYLPTLRNMPGNPLQKPQITP
jgi:hypothetical protein